MAVFAALAERARAVKRERLALALAVRHPSTPWYARLLVAGCVAYAVTPVDFIPDADCRARSREIEARTPRSSMPAWLALGAAWLAAVALIALGTVR